MNHIRKGGSSFPPGFHCSAYSHGFHAIARLAGRCSLTMCSREIGNSLDNPANYWTVLCAHIHTHTQTYYTMEKAVCNLIYNSSQLLLLVKQPILRVCGNYSSSCIQITSNLFTELKKILVNIKVHVHNE